MTKKSVLSAAILTALASTSAIAEVDTNKSAHNLTLEVPEVALIDMHNGNDCTLVAPTEAGKNFTPGTTTGYTYDITANKDKETSRTLQAQLNTEITLGIDLTVNVTIPTGATAVDDVLLSSENTADVVTGIENVVNSTLDVTYTCTNNADPIPDYGSQAIIINYTLTDDS